MDSIKIEVKPFLTGGHILVVALDKGKEKAQARYLPKYEYHYFMDDLERVIQPHL